MKRIMLLGFMLAAAQFTIAQTKMVDPSLSANLDPSISVNNYKHADKAAYAKANNLDRQTEMTSITVADQDAYKHPKKSEKEKRSASIPVSSGMSPAASHKHPHGL